MALSYDYSTKRITVPAADAVPLLMQDLINSIRTQEASEAGIVHDAIAQAAGKDDLGSGVYTGITVNLLSTWQLAFEAGAYQARVSGGNLADALARVYNTGSPQVLIQASAGATIINGSGGGGATAADVWSYGARTLSTTPPTASEVATAVWDKVLP